mmetsp:Transcript_5750/g.16665  ORF Transcript_5750/g.16665 Transcript_5750/m.16665 type:complete len:141 (-) Transcript_5750:162-584(-)
MKLYVIDLDHLALQVEESPPLMQWSARQRFRMRQFIEAEKAEKWHDDVDMASAFDQDPNIIVMRFRYSVEFLHMFNMGYQNYSQGEWEVARGFLLRAKDMTGVVDGPCEALLQYMERPHEFIPPPWWQGVRDLGDVTRAS